MSTEENAGGTYFFPLRVPYAHVDKMGFVYYSNYLVYFEMARAALLREADIPYAQLEERGIMLPVVESHCRYSKPAGYDDLLVVVSRCSMVRNTRLHVEYEIRRLGRGVDGGNTDFDEEDVRDAELICTGYTDHVCMTAEGSVTRMVDELKLFLKEKKDE